jgi:hypothetical protein
MRLQNRDIARTGYCRLNFEFTCQYATQNKYLSVISNSKVIQALERECPPVETQPLSHDTNLETVRWRAWKTPARLNASDAQQSEPKTNLELLRRAKTREYKKILSFVS